MSGTARRYPFVIGAGFGRTGTMSMKKALKQLLQQPVYHFDELLWRPDHVNAWHALVHEGAPMDWEWLYQDFAEKMDTVPAARVQEIAQPYLRQCRDDG